ncbi:hypothetical protein H8356DRAFT_1322982 [Neocallimastix lanati (nom. inval.)]|nr:hypothetical protein H8356DRAFT_1322982 [Neocallimastix sp. JGI-2020a]
MSLLKLSSLLELSVMVIISIALLCNTNCKKVKKVQRSYSNDNINSKFFDDMIMPYQDIKKN